MIRRMSQMNQTSQRTSTTQAGKTRQTSFGVVGRLLTVKSVRVNFEGPAGSDWKCDVGGGFLLKQQQKILYVFQTC